MTNKIEPASFRIGFKGSYSGGSFSVNEDNDEIEFCNTLDSPCMTMNLKGSLDCTVLGALRAITKRGSDFGILIVIDELPREES